MPAASVDRETDASRPTPADRTRAKGAWSHSHHAFVRTGSCRSAASCGRQALVVRVWAGCGSGRGGGDWTDRPVQPRLRRRSGPPSGGSTGGRHPALWPRARPGGGRHGRGGPAAGVGARRSGPRRLAHHPVGGPHSPSPCHIVFRLEPRVQRRPQPRKVSAAGLARRGLLPPTHSHHQRRLRVHPQRRATPSGSGPPVLARRVSGCRAPRRRTARAQAHLGGSHRGRRSGPGQTRRGWCSPSRIGS